MTRLIAGTLALAATALLTACSEEPASPPVIAPPVDIQAPESLQQAVTRETDAACEAAGTLRGAITRFLETPTAEHLVAARQQWQASHQSYGQALVAYQLAHMNPPQIAQDRDPVDAHPILPGYLDRVPGYPRSGLVYSEVPLTPAFLEEEHQSTDFFYATLGFHPLEVLLWGGIDPRPEFRAQLFQRPDSLPEDQVDARSRRIELLRLIAFALPRDVARLCAYNNRVALTQALAAVAAEPGQAGESLAEALDVMIDQPLARWQANPTGEDRNGMPVWHSAFARSDFDFLRSQLVAWHGTWLPELLPERATATLTERVEALSQRLEALAGTDGLPGMERVSEARSLLAQLRAELTADETASPEGSEEAGQ
ncbi:MAG: imelysin family protein [Marinobacter sp.]|uniref:imelysin family protein n=1 Tax=Marinobacter sp. TaxID=50741 RepID=UPI00299E8458|nr:imelysin family protein [Marinobacter sp.]MDX1635548.1 imelysin family protein [Marinobacter sp.]